MANANGRGHEPHRDSVANSVPERALPGGKPCGVAWDVCRDVYDLGGERCVRIVAAALRQAGAGR